METKTTLKSKIEFKLRAKFPCLKAKLSSTQCHRSCNFQERRALKLPALATGTRPNQSKCSTWASQELYIYMQIDLL